MVTIDFQARRRGGERVVTATTGAGFVEMRVSKVVGVGGADDEMLECIVLDEVGGNRHLVI
jgi:hypothetical protein